MEILGHEILSNGLSMYISLSHCSPVACEACVVQDFVDLDWTARAGFNTSLTELVQRAQTSRTSSDDEAWMAVYEEFLLEHLGCCAKREEDPCCVMNTVPDLESYVIAVSLNLVVRILITAFDVFLERIPQRANLHPLPAWRQNKKPF